MTIPDPKTIAITNFFIPLLASPPSSPSSSPHPLLLALSGPQGAGKTTLLSLLTPHLPPTTLFLSLDDFYLPRPSQLALATAHPDNPLLQYRGEPGTHDLPLLREVLGILLEWPGHPVKVPRYDKSAFNGQGDRLPEDQWTVVTKKPTVIIFEGWLLGFQAIPDSVIPSLQTPQSKTLQYHTLKTLTTINNYLKLYSTITSLFTAFVQLVAEDISYVYTWRLEAEHKMLLEKGTGMADKQVKKFIDSYMPAYEMYLKDLENGLLPEINEVKRNLRITIGKQRQVLDITIL